MGLYLSARESHKCLWDFENSMPASLTAILQLKLALEQQSDLKKSGYLFFTNHMRSKIATQGSGAGPEKSNYAGEEPRKQVLRGAADRTGGV